MINDDKKPLSLRCRPFSAAAATPCITELISFVRLAEKDGDFGTDQDHGEVKSTEEWRRGRIEERCLHPSISPDSFQLESM